MRHGSHLDPSNRFEKVHTVSDLEQLAWDDEPLKEPARPIEYLPDRAESIVTENRSPDVPFRYSVNPYRGCVHGCSYCYARNSHEYLGLNAGLDFETKIFVKHEAPRLLHDFLARDAWQPETIVFSGVTDCYQPAERQFRLTRQCVEVTAGCGQPIGVITKNALVLRDLDIFGTMAAQQLVHINLSLTTLDPDLARAMEPRTSVPAARLRAIRELAEAGVPVRVMVAPIIPGLNDHEIPAILAAAKEAGAGDAGYVLLRLPLTVEPVFREWLRRVRPLQADRVEQLIKQTRQGELSDSAWGQRMRGTGEIARQIETLFRVFHKKLGFSGLSPLRSDRFQPPRPRSGQLRLF